MKDGREASGFVDLQMRFEHRRVMSGELPRIGTFFEWKMTGGDKRIGGLSSGSSD
jgi:hypothetical protein